MGKSKSKAPASQKALTSSGFWPMLSKPAVAVGKHASVPGKYWNSCPAADKEKRFMCIVIEFVALHDFGDGVKGSGFKLKEMGEDGRGSLEPGIASGSEFIMAYPLPFLEHYYFNNRLELPDAVRVKAFPAGAVGTAGGGEVEDGGAAADGAADGAADCAADGALVKQEKERAAIFDFFQEVSSTLATAGPTRGKFTIKYKCCVVTPKGLCGGSATCYKTGDGKAETTSNAWTHLREKAKTCTAHQETLVRLEASNARTVQTADGEFVPVMNFAEAFPHHVRHNGSNSGPCPPQSLCC